MIRQLSESDSHPGYRMGLAPPKGFPIALWNPSAAYKNLYYLDCRVARPGNQAFVCAEKDALPQWESVLVVFMDGSVCGMIRAS